MNLFPGHGSVAWEILNNRIDFKKPWDDGEDEDEEVGRIPEGVLPRMRNVGLPLNVQRGAGSTPVTGSVTSLTSQLLVAFVGG